MVYVQQMYLEDVLFASTAGKFLKNFYANLTLKVPIFVHFYPYIQFEKLDSPFFLKRSTFGFPHTNLFFKFPLFETSKI